VPQRKDRTPKGRIKTRGLECGFEKEIFIDVPAIETEASEAVKPKAETPT